MNSAPPSDESGDRSRFVGEAGFELDKKNIFWAFEIDNFMNLWNSNGIQWIILCLHKRAFPAFWLFLKWEGGNLNEKGGSIYGQNWQGD
jgi:hypothetical protein